MRAVARIKREQTDISTAKLLCKLRHVSPETELSNLPHFTHFDMRAYFARWKQWGWRVFLLQSATIPAAMSIPTTYYQLVYKYRRVQDTHSCGRSLQQQSLYLPYPAFIIFTFIPMKVKRFFMRVFSVLQSQNSCIQILKSRLRNNGYFNYI